MNVILFKQIIQDFYVENLSEEVIICLIRAGMVLTITEIWKVLFRKEISAEALLIQWKKLHEINLQNKNVQLKKGNDKS